MDVNTCKCGATLLDSYEDECRECRIQDKLISMSLFDFVCNHMSEAGAEPKIEEAEPEEVKIMQELCNALEKWFFLHK